MKLQKIVASPGAGFSAPWSGARGVESMHLLNASPYWLAVIADESYTIDILAPWTRAELWLEGIRYGQVTLSDAGLGTVPGASTITGTGIYAGGTNVRLDTRHFALAVAEPVSGGAAAPAAVSVGLAAGRLDTGFAGRTNVIIVNNGTAAIYAGLGASAPAVTTATGLPIASGGGTATFRVGAAVQVWAISGTAGQDVRVAEF